MKKLTKWQLKILSIYANEDCALVKYGDDKFKILVYENDNIKSIPCTRMASIFIECSDVVRYDEKTDEMDLELIWYRVEEYLESEGIDFDFNRDINK